MIAYLKKSKQRAGWLTLWAVLALCGPGYSSSPPATTPPDHAPAPTTAPPAPHVTSVPMTRVADETPLKSATSIVELGTTKTSVQVTGGTPVPTPAEQTPVAAPHAAPEPLPVSETHAPSVTPPVTTPVTTPVTPPAAPAVRKTVTNLWVDTDLRQVMQDISSQTDIVIVCDQTVAGLVSMSVKDMPLEECLERACASGGYSYIQIKDYYLVGKADPGTSIFQRLSEPSRIKLSYIQPDQVKGLIHPSLIQYVTFDKATGTVVITAPEAIKARLLESIKQVDRPNRQVAIEAVVFELTEEGSKQLAMDWKFKAGNVGMSSVNLVNTFSYSAGSDLGVFVDATLRAIVETKTGQVLANPRVLVTNNTEAEIFVGQEKYYSLLSGQASNPYYTLQSIKAGVTLKVLPYIGDDGQITLDLEPEVSDVVSDTSQTSLNGVGGINSSPMPVVTRRHAKTVVNMRDGQTVLIGGLLMDQHRSKIDKIPGLGDVPVAGAPFRSVQSQRVQQEVVILITAHLADGRKSTKESLTARLTERYVSPLDAISTPLNGIRKCN